MNLCLTTTWALTVKQIIAKGIMVAIAVPMIIIITVVMDMIMVMTTDMDTVMTMGMTMDMGTGMTITEDMMDTKNMTRNVMAFIFFNVKMEFIESAAMVALRLQVNVWPNVQRVVVDTRMTIMVDTEDM